MGDEGPPPIIDQLTVEGTLPSTDGTPQLKDRWFADFLLEGAVRSELVSAAKFPASWENTGKSIDSGLGHSNLASKERVGSILYRRIP